MSDHQRKWYQTADGSYRCVGWGIGNDACANEARYYTSEHARTGYPSYCGLCDIKHNGGRGKLKSELNPASIPPAAVYGDNKDFAADTMSPETAELIVRLVNAEPEIIAALESAKRSLEHPGSGAMRSAALADVRAALAKVRP